jgi:hypothetical protein
LSDTSNHPWVRWRGAAVLVAVVVLVAGIAQTSLGQTLMRGSGLSRAQASYTSLAFARPQALPEQLKTQRAKIAVSFVISNSSETTRDYQWSLLLVQAGHTRRVTTGTVRIPASRGSAITQDVEISCTQKQFQIVVSLVRPAENIDSWTACPSNRS